MDEIVYFRPLNEADYTRIAELLLAELAGPLKERGITLSWTPEAAALLAKKATGGKRGARDLRNAIRREVEDPIAMAIVSRSEELLSAASLSAADAALTLVVS